MVWNAKWRMVSVNNVEAYLRATQASEEYIGRIKVIYAELATNPQAYVEEITVDKAAGKAQRVVFIRGEKKRDSGLLDIGKEIDILTSDGRKIKGTIHLESDTKLRMHEKGTGFESTVTLELHGDELDVTLVCGSVTGSAKFKRA